jgi:hypothetical protein
MSEPNDIVRRADGSPDLSHYAERARDLRARAQRDALAALPRWIARPVPPPGRNRREAPSR